MGEGNEEEPRGGIWGNLVNSGAFLGVFFWVLRGFLVFLGFGGPERILGEFWGFFGNSGGSGGDFGEFGGFFGEFGGNLGFFGAS